MRPAAIVVTAALLIAGCGSDSPEGAGPARPGTTASGAGDPDARAAGPELAPEPSTPSTFGLRVVSQNILHGIACPAQTAWCDLDSRVALFTSQLSDAGCPEVVAVQEANSTVLASFESHPAAGCGYEIVWDGDEGLDRELVLTTLDVVGERRLRLAGGFRTAYLVRLASPLGAIDVVGTHLASSDDGDCEPRTCPPPCDDDGRIRTCQARQVTEWARELAVEGGLVVIAGDLNAEVGDGPIDVLLGAGFVDSHLGAGRSECLPATGEGCTSGRDDASLRDMSDPTSLQRRRIDYVLYDAGRHECQLGPGTGLFNADPAPGPIAFPSDHTGVVLELDCLVDDDGRSETPVVALPPEPSAPPGTDDLPGGSADPATTAAITVAYETLFDGALADSDLRLDHLEGGQELRADFLAQLDAAGDLAAETRARIDSIALESEGRASVVFSILLGDQVVFDRIDGTAVRVGGRWLVSRTTFCDLAGQLLPDEPSSCR